MVLSSDFSFLEAWLAEPNSSANREQGTWQVGSKKKVNVFSANIFLSKKNQKIYLHVSNGNACGVQNLKLRYMYLWHVVKKDKNMYSAWLSHKVCN
jgi:hypothetical protein